MDDKPLSVTEASKLVGVNRRTIHKWIAAGKLKYVRTPGGSVRIFADSLWRHDNSNSKNDGNSQSDSNNNDNDKTDDEKGSR